MSINSVLNLACPFVNDSNPFSQLTNVFGHRQCQFSLLFRSLPFLVFFTWNWDQISWAGPISSDTNDRSLKSELNNSINHQLAPPIISEDRRTSRSLLSLSLLKAAQTSTVQEPFFLPRARLKFVPVEPLRPDNDEFGMKWALPINQQPTFLGSLT